MQTEAVDDAAGCSPQDCLASSVSPVSLSKQRELAQLKRQMPYQVPSQ